MRGELLLQAALATTSPAMSGIVGRVATPRHVRVQVRPVCVHMCVLMCVHMHVGAHVGMLMRSAQRTIGLPLTRPSSRVAPSAIAQVRAPPGPPHVRG